MKVFVDYKLNDTGKGKFLMRLIPALSAIKVDCVFKQAGCDIALGITKWRGQIKRLPKILRVDGVHLSKGKKYEYRNQQIRESIKKSNAVIFQSKFARDTAMRVLDIIPLRKYVIYNGANPKDYEIDPLKLPHKHNVLMCARWANRKSKRLKEHLKVVDGYLNRKDVHFYLAGEHPPIEPRENLTDLGYIPDVELRKYQVSCEYFIYLAHPDWCPNSVVEAKVAGMGINFERGCGVEELVNLPKEELYIENVAQQYKNAFAEVLNGA